MDKTTRVSSADEEYIGKALALLSELDFHRSTFAGHWEEVAQLILPSQRNTFFRGTRNTPGEKKTQRQIDAQGQLALERYSAILDSLITPRNQIYHQLAASNPYVMKDRATQLWFEEANRLLFQWRYNAMSGFAGQNNQNWTGIGAFGSSFLFVDALDTQRGMRYKNVPVGQSYPIENHQGIVTGFMRVFRYTAAQAFSRPEWKGMIPDCILSALHKGSQQPFEFVHYVHERDEGYDPGRLDEKGKKFASCYISIEGKCIMSKGGFRTFPYASARLNQIEGETFGRSPAMMVLPSLKTKNAQKAVFLKQGHRAADPVLLTPDDGVVDFSMRPGALNKGGMTADGRPLVGILPTGNIQINEKMMEAEGAIIDDAFLVSLFQIVTESPQMTATEVVERVNEKGILLAPTVGGVAAERLAPQIDRELDILTYQGILPPMPPRLREAQGEYDVVYTSPLAKAAKAQEAAGFMRTVETVKELVGVTQDSSLLDPFDFDVAVPAIAEIQSVPASWMASPEKIAEKRKARANAQQRQEQIQAAPAQAAMMKAQATMMEAGGGGPGG